MLRPRGANLTFESAFAASSRSNVKFKSSAKNIKLLVVLLIPAFALQVLQAEANVGIGPLAIFWMSVFFRSARVQAHV
jgi:hypothetical protein